MGKSTISMAMFNSYVKLPEGMGYPWEYGHIQLDTGLESMVSLVWESYFS
jgi:hypothetical protein